MTNGSINTHTEEYFQSPIIFWNAIFIGAAVAIGLGFLLHLLTTGLSLSAFTISNTGITTLAIGGIAWLLICGYISMFIAGWITANLIDDHYMDSKLGMIHGFAAWCVALIISIALVSGFGSFMAVTIPLNDALNKTTMVAAHLNTNLNLTSNADNLQTSNPEILANNAAVAKQLGVGSLVTFIIFLVGAIGSIMGGLFGVKRKQTAKF